MDGLTERIIDPGTVRLAVGSRARAALVDAVGALPRHRPDERPGPRRHGGRVAAHAHSTHSPRHLNMKPPRGLLDVAMKVHGDVVAEGTLPVSVPIGFTATECLDIGISLGSAVSPDYRLVSRGFSCARVSV